MFVAVDAAEGAGQESVLGSFLIYYKTPAEVPLLAVGLDPMVPLVAWYPVHPWRSWLVTC